MHEHVLSEALAQAHPLFSHIFKDSPDQLPKRRQIEEGVFRRRRTSLGGPGNRMVGGVVSDRFDLLRSRCIANLVTGTAISIRRRP